VVVRKGNNGKRGNSFVLDVILLLDAHVIGIHGSLIQMSEEIS
jgi:hypothetical protein